MEDQSTPSGRKREIVLIDRRPRRVLVERREGLEFATSTGA